MASWWSPRFAHPTFRCSRKPGRLRSQAFLLFPWEKEHLGSAIWGTLLATDRATTKLHD